MPNTEDSQRLLEKERPTTYGAESNPKQSQETPKQSQETPKQSKETPKQILPTPEQIQEKQKKIKRRYIFGCCFGAGLLLTETGIMAYHTVLFGDEHLKHHSETGEWNKKFLITGLVATGIGVVLLFAGLYHLYHEYHVGKQMIANFTESNAFIKKSIKHSNKIRSEIKELQVKVADPSISRQEIMLELEKLLENNPALPTPPAPPAQLQVKPSQQQKQSGQENIPSISRSKSAASIAPTGSMGSSYFEQVKNSSRSRSKSAGNSIV